MEILDKKVIVLGVVLILAITFIYISQEETNFKKNNSLLTGNFISEFLGENYSLEIGGEEFNPEETYTGIREVIIKYKDKEKISFEWNFSQGIEGLEEIEIQIQPDSSSFGYTIINGLEIEKTLYIDRKTNSRIVCLKDRHVENINEITSSCNGSYETPLRCEEISLEKGCQITEDVFIVTGIQNSGVKEFYGEVIINLTLPDYEECYPNWSCSEWSACVKGKNTRACIDQNACINESDRPVEEKECEEGCIPEWICYPWSKCNDDKNQTRICEDVNYCGDEKEKPIEERECLSQGRDTNTIAKIIFYSLLFFILIIFIIITYIMIKRRYFPSADQEDLYDFEDIQDLENPVDNQGRENI